MGAAGIAAIAGCGGSSSEETATETASTTTAEETTMGEGMESVPAEYETATGLDGSERDPDALATKDAVNYQTEPNDGAQCSDCSFYIADKNDDGLGACTLVEGTIDPSGWCSSFVEYDSES
jgi:hypothetical protein